MARFQFPTHRVKNSDSATSRIRRRHGCRRRPAGSWQNCPGEILEQKKLLSGVMADGSEVAAADSQQAIASVQTEFVNDSGQVLSDVRVGEEFTVLVTVADNRDTPEGVFSAYLDLDYDESRMEVISWDVLLPVRQRGELDPNDGAFDEVGGLLGSPFASNQAVTEVLRIRAKALTAGELTVSTNPAEGNFNQINLYNHVQDLRMDADYELAHLQVLPVSGSVPELNSALFSGTDLHLTLNEGAPTTGSFDVVIESSAGGTITEHGRVTVTSSDSAGLRDIIVNVGSIDFTVQDLDDQDPSWTVRLANGDKTSDPVAASGIVTDGMGGVLVLGTADADAVVVDSGVLRMTTGELVTEVPLDSATRIAVYSRDGDDRIDLSESTVPVQVFGGEGDDVINGGSAADNLYGNEGHDFVFGGAGNDSISGGAGNDRLIGAADDDELDGGDGDDFVAGSAGRDSLRGGAGNDEVFGNGSAGDSLSGGLGDDTLDGGKGGDFLVESADADLTLVDGRLTGIGSDTLIGIEGAKLRGGSGNNVIDASGFSASVTVHGGSGHDTLIGTADNDMLFGESGRDELIGGEGNDRLDGGGSGDRLIGQAGNDRLLGRGGHDDLYGGEGDDSLFGHAGNDTIHAETTGNLTLKKKWLFGQGRDRIRDIEQAVLTGDDNDNRLDARLFQGSGGVTLQGGAGDDFLRGSKHADEIDGADGNDRIFGLAGADRISIGTGSDQADGGAGTDTLLDNHHSEANDTLISLEEAIATLSATDAKLAQVDEFFSGDLSYLRE